MSIIVFEDGSVSVNGTATPYRFRRIDGANDEFWRSEDPFFGTRFKRLCLPRKSTSATLTVAQPLPMTSLRRLKRTGGTSPLRPLIIKLAFYASL